MLIDLHAYPMQGGTASLPAVVERARHLGLDGVCLVDRQMARDAARSVLSGAFGDFPVFVGAEISTRSGDVIAIVPELDPFYVQEEWRQVDSLQARPPLRDVQELVEAHQGVVLVSHPYDRDRQTLMRDRLFLLDGVAGVEIATGGAHPMANQLALEAVGRAPFPSFAGSADRRGRDGTPVWATLFEERPRTQAELVAALRGGNFWAVEVQPERNGSSGGASRPQERRDSDERRGGGRPPGRGGSRGGSDRQGRRRN